MSQKGNDHQLVLTRKLGEKIMIDNGKIVITVLLIDRGKVRLGIKAGHDIVIDREEVYEAKLTELYEQQKQLNKLQDKVQNEGQTNQGQDIERFPPHEEGHPVG